MQTNLESFSDEWAFLFGHFHVTVTRLAYSSVADFLNSDSTTYLSNTQFFIFLFFVVWLENDVVNSIQSRNGYQECQWLSIFLFPIVAWFLIVEDVLKQEVRWLIIQKHS